MTEVVEVTVTPQPEVDVEVQPVAPIDVSWGPVGIAGPPGPPGHDGFIVLPPGGTVPPGTPTGTVIIERSA